MLSLQFYMYLYVYFLHVSVLKLRGQSFVVSSLSVCCTTLRKYRLFDITRLIYKSMCATLQLFYTTPDVICAFISKAGVEIIICSIDLSLFTWSHLLHFITGISYYRTFPECVCLMEISWWAMSIANIEVVLTLTLKFEVNWNGSVCVLCTIEILKHFYHIDYEFNRQDRELESYSKVTILTCISCLLWSFKVNLNAIEIFIY